MVTEEVKFTKEQEEAINFGGNQLLVKGIAGSGKTLVLLKSAIDLAKKNPTEQVAVFSFGNPLSVAAEEMVKQYNLPNLTVTTFHKWAYRAYCETFKRKPNYMENKKNPFKPALKEVGIAYPKHRFFKNDTLHQFLKEEIQWIKGRNIKSEVEYVKAERKGRGSKVRLSENDRKIVYKIFTVYENKKGAALDFEDSAVKLVDAQNKIPNSVKYDHIIIDEAQDLNKVCLQLLSGISRKSCRIGADIGQKIYPTTFTWKEAGLDFRGNRVKTLQNSFRSTKQIVQLAQSLQKNDEISKDEEFTSPILPSIEGVIPTITFCPNEQAHDKATIDFIKDLLKSSENASIGILFRNWESATRLQTKMRNERIPFTEIGRSSDFRRSFKVDQGSHKQPGIKFTTFHTAKGLEFTYVIIIDLINPSAEALLGDEFDWDLERRLLYVAMTRAKVGLTIFTHEEKAKLIKELNEEFYTKIEV